MNVDLVVGGWLESSELFQPGSGSLSVYDVTGKPELVSCLNIALECLLTCHSLKIKHI